MCVGCYGIPIMTLISPSFESTPATTVPLIDSAKTEINRPRMSAAVARAEIVAMVQRLPDSAEVQMITEQCSAIHQRLEDITRSEQVNAILSEGILSIADCLDRTNANPITKILPKTQDWDVSGQTAHLLPLEQQTWGWLS